MKVEVVNGLARPGIYVENRPVPLLMDIRLHGKLLGDLKHLANECVIFRR
jgi:hypothetical protein